jgi:hypothetical protein
MADFLDKIVQVDITRETTVPSMASFNGHLIVDAFDPAGITPVFDADHRVRKFGSLDEIVAAGFPSTGFVYKSASKQYAQSNHIGDIYVGLKAAGDTDWTAALNAIKQQSNAWYAIDTSARGMADQQLIAQWIQANNKLGCLDTGDTTLVNEESGDIASYCKTNSLDRVIVFYHPDCGVNESGVLLDNDPTPAAALFGLMLSKQPGSPNWKFKKLASVPTYDLTDAQYTNAMAKNAMIFPSVADVPCTMEGKTAGGEYIDVIHGCDWLKARIQNLVFTALVQTDKVPFTDAGIQQIVAPLQNALDEGVRYGILASYTVSYPKAADVSITDKGVRNLPDVTFNAPLAGAINSTVIKGTVTL